MDIFWFGLCLAVLALIVAAVVALAHKNRYRPDEEPQDGNLVKHARYELELMGEDPDVIDWMVDVVRTYASYGHSGGSHAVLLPVLIELLQYNNLTDLTDHPDEWLYHGPEISGYENGIWQSRRNSKAMSIDGGKTYTLVDEDDYTENPHKHVSTQTVFPFEP